MKRNFTLALLAAALLTSTGAQAHQYQAKIDGWRASLTAVGDKLQAIECYSNGTVEGTKATTCEPAGTAFLASEMLRTIKPDATDAEAQNMFDLVFSALNIGDNSMVIAPMVEELKGSKQKLAALADGLDERAHIAGDIALYATPRKGAAK